MRGITLIKNNSLVKVIGAGLIFTILASGCENKSLSPNVSSSNPAITPILTPAPIPSPTATLHETVTATATLEPTLESTSTLKPTATPEPIILSARGDKWCPMRFKDRVAEDIQRGAIAIIYIQVGDEYKVNLCIRASKGEIGDFSTTKVLFEKEGDKFVPTDVMKEVGEAKFLAFDTLSAYMTETLKLSEETAQEELSKIKTGFDLISWYVKYVPNNQQLVIPWKDLEAFLSVDQPINCKVDLKAKSVVDSINSGEYTLRDLYKGNAPKTADEVIETNDLQKGSFEYSKKGSKVA
jgi:hypothetical protein